MHSEITLAHWNALKRFRKLPRLGRWKLRDWPTRSSTKASRTPGTTGRPAIPEKPPASLSVFSPSVYLLME